MSELRSKWIRLGVGFVGEPAQEAVDLEALILETAQEGPLDARLFWGAASWLAEYGELVDGRRLAAKIGKGGGSAELAVLVVASGIGSLQGVLQKCRRRTPAAPMFEVEAVQPVLRAKVEAGALPEFREWGLLLDERCLCRDALRPSSWVLRHNPNLVVRAVLGAGLRAELLNTLLDVGGELTARDLQRRSGRQYASVHAALGGLRLANLVTRREAGRRVLYRVPTEVRAWLAEFPGVAVRGRRAA